MTDEGTMLEDIGPHDNDLHGTFNAQVWAERFVKRVTENPLIATDEGTMLAWFAGAIMTGHDYAYEKIRQDAMAKDADCVAEPEPALPDGEYARVEIMGHDCETGWVTDGTRAGVPVMVIRNHDGRVIREVPGHALFTFVPLPTPLKRPGVSLSPRAAIAAGDPWADARDDDFVQDRHADLDPHADEAGYDGGPC
jgi:hypothetical protein